MRIAFRWNGQQYAAEVLARGRKNIRVGWLHAEVPQVLEQHIEPSQTRPGWATMLLPVKGPEAVDLEEVANAEAIIKRRQIAWAVAKGLPLQKGSPGSREMALYTATLEQNLFEPLTADATAEFEQGDGTPLRGKDGGLPHLRALHNSDAIAVNVFAYWKSRDVRRIGQYLGIPTHGLATLSFEKKFRIFPRSTRMPNIDVAFEYDPGSEHDWVGVECKLTETYPARARKQFDEKYFVEGDWWDGLPNTLDLAKTFRGSGIERVRRHLDRGQLIKHVLGLRNACRSQGTKLDRAQLIYLWYDVDSPEATRHREEIESLSKVFASDGVMFRSITWQCLINDLASGEKEHHPRYVTYLTDRYL